MIGNSYKKLSEIIRVAQLGNNGVTAGKAYTKTDSLKTEKIINNNNLPFKKIPMINLNVKKWDVHSLISTIEEIESKIKLKNILNKTTVADHQDNNSTQECIKNSREIRLNLSMLNISRNLVAVEYSQAHPSDEKSNLTA